MRTHARLALVSALAVACLAAAAGVAGAGRMSVSNQEFRIVTLTESEPAEGGAAQWSCPITLTGRFHSRTFIKQVDSLIGNITAAARGAEGCGFGGGASAMALLAETLPWHVQYASISGVLPRIAAFTFRIIGMSWLVTYLGGIFQCLYRSTAAAPARGSFLFEGTRVRGFAWDESASIPLFAGEELCPEEVVLTGTGTVTLAGTANAIFASLI